MENITAYPLTWPNSKPQKSYYERKSAPFGKIGTRGWREVFSVKDGATPTLERLKVRYRAISKIRHPDNLQTGSKEKFQELQEAFEQAKRECSQ